MQERVRELFKISPYVGYNMKNDQTNVNPIYSVAMPESETPLRSMVLNNMRHSLNYLKNPSSFNDEDAVNALLANKKVGFKDYNACNKSYYLKSQQNKLKNIDKIENDSVQLHKRSISCDPANISNPRTKRNLSICKEVRENDSPQLNLPKRSSKRVSINLDGPRKNNSCEVKLRNESNNDLQVKEKWIAGIEKSMAKRVVENTDNPQSTNLLLLKKKQKKQDRKQLLRSKDVKNKDQAKVFQETEKLQKDMDFKDRLR